MCAVTCEEGEGDVAALFIYLYGLHVWLCLHGGLGVVYGFSV